MKIRRLLKAAQTQLNMDQADYVANLKTITGKTSSTELTYFECHQVLKHFESLGYKPEKPKNERQIKRIRYLWMCLGENGKLNNNSSHAMRTFCQKFTNGQSIFNARSDQLSACIEALKSWCNREGVNFNG